MPSSETDGAGIEGRVVGALEALGVPWERVPIDPAFADTAAFCERYDVPPAHAANTLLVASKTEPRQYCACVVLATTRLDVNHAVRKLMGVRKASFASADETRAVTGMMIGGVTVLALPAGLPIYVDAKLMDLPWIILGSGSRSSKIKTSPEVFRRLPEAAIVQALATEVM